MTKKTLLGLIGHPVEHSLSAPMHNSAFKYLNLDYRYNLFNVKENELELAINGAKALGFKGFNITIPYKETVIPFLDEISSDAKRIGAVNTIKFENNKILGYNTDGIGAVKAIEEKRNLKGKKIVITGAGGASKAIAYNLCLKKIDELIILNRNIKRAEELSKNLKHNFKDKKISYGSLDALEEELQSAEIFIDTTPVGLSPNDKEKAIASSEILHPDLLVNDIIYTPLESSLLKEAKKADAETLSGLKMLVYQGAESFKIWTKKEAPKDIMEVAVLKILNK